MRKTAYTKTILIFFVSTLLYGCGAKNNDTSNELFQIQNKVLENKFIRNFRNISRSGNIYEDLQINIHGTSNDLDLKFDIASKIYKNLGSNSQKGSYTFQMISKREEFDETEVISGFVDFVSIEKEYFLRPKEIDFSGPKGKYSNKNIEDKVTDIEDHRIKIDKEIPFKNTMESIFNIQKLLKNSKDISFTNQSGFTSITSKDNLINGKISSNVGIFYLSGGQFIQIHKDGHKFKFYLSGQESDTNLDIKVKNGMNGLILNFKGNISYKNISPLSLEIKLDIKGKYVIRDTGHIQVDLPTDYLNLTQTSLTKK